MKKKIIGLLLTVMFFGTGYSQDLSKFNLYKPAEDAEKALEAVVKQAKKEGKHVFVQAGGNWCIWCARFNDFVTKDLSLDSMIQKNYVVYHLNYSKENFIRTFNSSFNGRHAFFYFFEDVFGYNDSIINNQTCCEYNR